MLHLAKHLVTLIATIVAACAVSAETFAQVAVPPSTSPLKVGVFVEAPFVTKDAKGTLDGFSVAVWKAIEPKLGVTANFCEFDSFPALVEAVASGSIDLAVCGMLMTSALEHRLEFTHPVANGGLRVMVDSAPKHSLQALWRGLVENGHVTILGYGALIVGACSIPLMFIWRKLDKDFPATPHDGFAEAFYRTVSLTMSGKAKVTTVSTWITKLLAACWLVCGVGIVAYVTSSVTAVMTTQSLRQSINSVDDLAGKPVGVITGTLGESYCVSRGFETRTFLTIKAAVDALVAHEVLALVADGPELEAFDQANPALPITEVGPLFAKRRYAFAVPMHSALRHRINIALVEIEESGESEKIHRKYFGGA